MALKSELFAGDAKLEAAAISNPAHVVPGAVGPHVRKLQIALRRLDKATIDRGEIAAQRYGPSTAAAVLKYKQSRTIVNRSYQSSADNIVGIMTMARLDSDLAKFEADNPRELVAMRPFRCSVGSS